MKIRFFRKKVRTVNDLLKESETLMNHTAILVILGLVVFILYFITSDVALGIICCLTLALSALTFDLSLLIKVDAIMKIKESKTKEEKVDA
mgnify:CR=1 FL=1